MKSTLPLLFAVLFSGCSAIQTAETPARLYNLDSGDVVSIQLHKFQSDGGRATGVMSTGETLEGEFSLMGENPNLTKGKDLQRSGLMKSAETTWSEAYGFSTSAKATPLGTGTLVGSQGTVLQLVLYTADKWEARGDGVAKDNHGNWYRLHIGSIE